MPTLLRDRMRLVREEAIVDVVNRLLADKGYEFMTVDEVAAEVGMAKASLYKHFPSKEALAAAAMVRTLERALAQIDEIERGPPRPAFARLQDMLHWTMSTLYEGRMPSLPAQNSALRAVLTADKAYVKLLMQMSDRLGSWITQAQRDGTVAAALPAEVVLFTLFARACDPVLPLLKATGQYTSEQIFGWMQHTCFLGIGGAAGTGHEALATSAASARATGPASSAPAPSVLMPSAPQPAPPAARATGSAKPQRAIPPRPRSRARKALSG